MYYFTEKREVTTENIKLAQATIPYQQYKELYGSDEGLYKGTMFKELFSPYKKVSTYKS